MIKKILGTFLGLFLGLTLFGIGLLAIAVLITYPKLPTLEAVTHYNPKMPLQIYSADDKLIGLYGEERRSFMKIDEFPLVLKQAVIAAEDKRFYEHWGVDVIGVTRAMVGNLTSGSVQSGASTITQQVAKNFFLTNERTFTRKFNEALLAYKIEKNLSKDQILELYFNQIYLGQRAYGFAAASEAYFNKPVKDIDLAEASILAGLPKAPSAFNPIVNPERAKIRQEYILNNMQELGMITEAEKNTAFAEKLTYERARFNLDEYSLYAAEMARQSMVEKYGEEAYTQGFRVYTTVNSELQQVGTKSLRKALDTFDRGRRFHGAEARINLKNLKQEGDLEEQLEQYLSTLHTVEGRVPAVVLKANKNSLDVYVEGQGRVSLTSNQINLVKSAINNNKLGDKQVQEGAVIRVKEQKNGWSVVQSPDLQGALVSINAQTGAIQAIVGGYDFYQRSFNRATQAWRQPGSTFKPFIYSAGIEKGFTVASVVNDAPIEIPGMGAGGKAWRPKNSNGRYSGYITLRQALVASKNMVTIRIMMAVTPQYAQQYIQRFGFRAKEHPATLAMSLGSGSVTPLQMAEAYAIFANGGYRVSAYIIDRIYDGTGRLRAQTKPLVAGENAKLAIDPRNAFIMNTVLRDVVRMGTASRANALGRNDIYGKTGTTNQGKDAWFVGYNPQIVTAVYVGFDQPSSLGPSGYGGVIALPVWVEYMRAALKGKPVVQPKPPAGLVQRGGDYFYQEHQSTNPNLGLDNRASGGANESGISDEGGASIAPSKPSGAAAGQDVPPVNAPAPGAAKPATNLDALF